MAWFKRWRNKMRNYTSGGDYPGGYGAGAAKESAAASEARLGHEISKLRDTSSPN